MDTVEMNLLYHTVVRWFLKINALKRFLNLKDETEILKLQRKCIGLIYR